jgi:hypothetical protein
MIAYIQATFDDAPDFKIYVEAVHRLNTLGAVVTIASHGTSQEGFDAEWHDANVLTVTGDVISRCELFDQADLDDAIAQFDQLSQPAPRPENAASQVAERFWAHFTARDWDAMAEILTDDISTDDRRRVVNAGLRRGRDAEIAGMRATAEVTVSGTLSVIAIRGERLALSRLHLSGRDQRPEAFHSEALGIVEIDADNRIAAHIAFDLDDIEAAFEELETRYLAGEAATDSHSWSVIARSVAGINRHELPATTPGWINIDHRRVTSFAPGDLFAFLRASWDQIPDIKFRVETVHRLSDLGAVVTQAVRGTSQEGFDAEWRYINVATVEGDLINDCELFDETDIDAALARFDELSLPAPQLENAASRAYDRFNAYLAARDWDAMAEMITDDICNDDRRRVVSGGVQRGRHAQTANLRAVVDVGVKNFESVVIATRGERLALSRTRVSGGQRPEAFGLELLTIIEIDTDNRIAAGIQFDIDDLHGAFEELETRYLAGEAAAHAQTWSVIAGARAALVRRELPPTTPDWVNLDHRRGIAFAPGDTTAYFRALWDAERDFSTYIEAVYRLNDVGTVFTQVARGTTHEGFDAEWRVVEFMTVDGDLVSRAEFFDEADIDAALARFEELSRPAPRLENAASQMNDRFLACFAARDWDAMAALMVDDSSIDDRRRVVNAGLRRGRDAEIASMRAIADLGVQEATSVVIATRGERLALSRDRFLEPEGFLTEVLGVLEINADERIGAVVVFDVDDIDAAFEELDARYLAGEAAAHAHAWSVIAGAVAAANRHEFPALTPDWVNVDHRRAIAFAPGDMTAYVEAIWDTTPHTTTYVEAVHRLSAAGAVVTQAARGTSQQGFEAEWRMIGLTTVEGDLVNRCELFDEADLDAALAKFDELSRPSTPRLENAASRVDERVWTHFAARDWVAIAEMLAADISTHDRCRVVGAGVREGRDAELADMRVWADLGVTTATSAVIATRGAHLLLARTNFSGRDQRPDAFHGEYLGILEIDADERIVARLWFDLDDIDAAFEELDARYLAGEAAAHAHTWSVIASSYAALSRHELPPTAADWVTIDHRRGSPFAHSDLTEIISTSRDLTPDLRSHVETVHLLSHVGAVVTQRSYGTSHQGFDAEWRMIILSTVAGDLISRCEIFDETDIDPALTRFDELSRPATRLENAASRAFKRFQTYFAAREWTAMAEILAEDMCNDDRRRVVGAGVLRGRDTDVAHMRAIADVGAKTITSTVVATRGERLVLRRVLFSGEDQGSEAFEAELLGIVEIDADERIVARLSFDADDVAAAFEELDTRYLAGDSTAHAHTWSVIAATYAAFNRHGLVPDWVSVDHRRGSPFASSDLNATIRASRDLTPDLTIHIETVHRLSAFGAVVTNTSFGTSDEGFAAEWRMVQLLTVDGERVTRLEIFDEDDIDAALAGFDDLNRPAPQLENAASQMDDRFWTYFAARDWTAMAEILAEDMCNDDRRRVVGAGVLRGRDTDVAHMRAIADVGAKTMASTVVATRGERLVLRRVLFSGEDQGPEAFEAELLGIVEIDADERIVARVSFDVDDIDAAFAELDARYLAGEAAAHAHTWSVIASVYAAFNRHELPARTADWVSIDHRPLVAIEASDLAASIRAVWDLTPELRIHIEAVHRLTDLGAIITHAAHGVTPEGFDAEWRMVFIYTVDGDLINRYELFDEADIDSAMGRFDELNHPSPQLENAATRTWRQIVDACNRRDADGFLALTSADGELEDRRKGLHVSLEGSARRKAAQSLCRAPKSWRMEVEPIAIRGYRLGLTRERWRDTDEADRPITVEALTLTEVAGDELVHHTEVFDPDDIDVAFAALDARYIAGEAADHSHTWSVVKDAYAAFNRREAPPTAPDWTNIDHRRAIAVTPGDMTAYINATLELTPDVNLYIEAVHRLSNLGAVVTHVSKGTSQQGFDAEWRLLNLMTVEGDLINRCELFDEEDLDAALARFDELNRPAPKLENAAIRARARVADTYNRRDVEGFLALAGGRYEDRRKGLRDEGAADRNFAQAVLSETPTSWRLEIEPVAIRGDRLALSRETFREADEANQPITVELIVLTEVADAELDSYTVFFDPDDINSAIAELTARWIASGEVAHPDVIESVQQINEIVSRHDWDAIAKHFAGASYVNHRQLAQAGTGTIADWLSSMRTIESLVPDFWVEFAEVLARCAIGIVGRMTLKGTSTEGSAIEIPYVLLILFDGGRVTRFEAFDEDQRDLAMARFDELNRPA